MMNDADLIENIRCATCGRPVPENHVLLSRSPGREDRYVCSYPCAAGDTSWAEGKTMRRPWMDIAIPLVVLVCLLLSTWSVWQVHRQRLVSEAQNHVTAQAIEGLTKRVEDMKHGTNP